ncbi:MULTISPECIES: hypothetical protein [unclassified Variovorax]|uniref:hypothetical protein n=1 Tax=unclassified Variovorax TaxID=663243 RepID=UPI003ECDCBC3
MFTVYVTGIATGEELDALVRYDTLDTIRSIVNRLETIVASGIYCATPAFDESAPIWRYNLTALSQTEQRLLVWTHRRGPQRPRRARNDRQARSRCGGRKPTRQDLTNYRFYEDWFVKPGFLRDVESAAAWRSRILVQGRGVMERSSQ